MLKLHDIDLNLLRLFDAVYRARSVSRAAEALGLTQPAASQGLTRLRLLLKDALFVRAPGGVAPTPRAERLSRSVQAALSLMEVALNESDRFDPAESQRSFRIHMSDIGEARFLPDLMAAVQAQAPGVRIETRPLPSDAIAQALDEGHIDLAFGFLPSVKETRQAVMLSDRYIVLLRAGHPFTRRKRSPQALLDDLPQLEFVAVRTHTNPLRILQQLNLEARVRLTTEHFMVLPSIVRSTDLAVLMPRSIALGFAGQGGYALVEPPFALRDFDVALHWSARFEADPGLAWLRELILQLFTEPANKAPASSRQNSSAA